nr:MAG TPA: hypothetical protein [Caudoviricetes sp.]
MLESQPKAMRKSINSVFQSTTRNRLPAVFFHHFYCF